MNSLFLWMMNKQFKKSDSPVVITPRRFLSLHAPLVLQDADPFHYNSLVRFDWSKVQAACLSAHIFSTSSVHPMTRLAQVLPSLSRLKKIEFISAPASPSKISSSQYRQHIKLFLKELHHPCHPPYRLEELDLEKLKLPSDMICSLAPILKQCPRLRVLKLGGGRPKDKDIKALSKTLPHLSQLKNLDLSDNQLDYSDLALLLSDRDFFAQLSTLNLGENNFAEQGVQRLGQTAAYMRHLQYLNLESNAIGDQGIHSCIKTTLSLFSDHMVWTSLRSLNLDTNELSDKGIESLNVLIRFVPHLQHLSLKNNLITQEGAHSLSLSLQTCRDFEALDVHNNMISLMGFQFLLTTLNSIPNFKQMECGENPFDFLELEDFQHNHFPHRDVLLKNTGD